MTTLQLAGELIRCRECGDAHTFHAEGAALFSSTNQLMLHCHNDACDLKGPLASLGHDWMRSMEKEKEDLDDNESALWEHLTLIGTLQATYNALVAAQDAAELKLGPSSLPSIETDDIKLSNINQISRPSSNSTSTWGDIMEEVDSNTAWAPLPVKKITKSTDSKQHKKQAQFLFEGHSRTGATLLSHIANTTRNNATSHRNPFKALHPPSRAISPTKVAMSRSLSNSPTDKSNTSPPPSKMSSSATPPQQKPNSAPQVTPVIPPSTMPPPQSPIEVMKAEIASLRETVTLMNNTINKLMDLVTRGDLRHPRGMDAHGRGRDRGGADRGRAKGEKASKPKKASRGRGDKERRDYDGGSSEGEDMERTKAPVEQATVYETQDARPTFNTRRDIDSWFRDLYMLLDDRLTREYTARINEGMLPEESLAIKEREEEEADLILRQQSDAFEETLERDGFVEGTEETPPSYADKARAGPRDHKSTRARTKERDTAFSFFQKPAPQEWKSIKISWNPSREVRTSEDKKLMNKMAWRAIEKLKIRSRVKDISLIGKSVLILYYCQAAAAEVEQALEKAKVTVITSDLRKTPPLGKTTDTKAKALNRTSYLCAKHRYLPKLVSIFMSEIPIEWHEECARKTAERTTAIHDSN